MQQMTMAQQQQQRNHPHSYVVPATAKGFGFMQPGGAVQQQPPGARQVREKSLRGKISVLSDRAKNYIALPSDPHSMAPYVDPAVRSLFDYTIFFSCLCSFSSSSSLASSGWGSAAAAAAVGLAAQSDSESNF
jgi:hypothetical protein